MFEENEIIETPCSKLYKVLDDIMTDLLNNPQIIKHQIKQGNTTTLKIVIDTILKLEENKAVRKTEKPKTREITPDMDYDEAFQILKESLQELPDWEK